MDLHDNLDILRRRWATVLAATLVMIAVAVAVNLATTPQFSSTTRLFFAVDTSESVTDLAQGSTFAEKQMTSYAEVVTSPLVLDPVIDKLDVPLDSTQLAEMVTVTIPPETVILDISVTTTDAREAARFANAIGREVAGVAASLAPEGADGSTTVRATTIAPAVASESPSSPRVLRNLALGLALGLLLGLGIAFLRHALDTKVRAEQDLRAMTDSPVLGVIGFEEKVASHPVILRDDPMSGAAEAVRRLRTNLQFIDVGDRPRSLVVTSSIPAEGKTTTSVNLAVALADAGSRVILVDADLRRPSVAELLGMEGRAGLTTVLIGQAKVADLVQPWQDGAVDVLTSGLIPPNPSELLGSWAMERLLEELTSTYDVVLLDSPPLLPVTDAALLSKLAGGSLVVVGADRIRRPQLQEALSSLETAGAHLHGLVLNKITRQESNTYYRYDSGYRPLDQDGPRRPGRSSGKGSHPGSRGAWDLPQRELAARAAQKRPVDARR